MKCVPSILLSSLLVLTVTACAGQSPMHGSVSGPIPCIAAEARWPIPESGKRVLRVALAPDQGTLDGWSFFGAERLRTATESWNLLELPIRLLPTDDFARADVRVFIVRSIPADSAGSPQLAQYQAGLTRLTRDLSGTIVRAHIAIAETSPAGVAYSVGEQVATLMHELGHSLGVPHATSPLALMSPRPLVSSITRTDVRMARDVYARASCPGNAVASR